MKKIIVLLTFTIVLNITYGQTEKYVSYLQKPHLSAKNYIIGLFKKYDMVILCERAHAELTQYDLYLDVISDPWFVKNVGNVFTETGSISNRESINNFIHTKYEHDSIKEPDLIKICQNVNFYGV